jgi:hypothetical protein
MKVTGAEVIYLVLSASMLWFGLKSGWEAVYVIRGRTTDRNGNTLWFYAHVDGLPVGAKNRKQALILTLGVAVIGIVLGLPYVALFLLKHVI